jgi:hypothetical protein
MSAERHQGTLERTVRIRHRSSETDRYGAASRCVQLVIVHRIERVRPINELLGKQG